MLWKRAGCLSKEQGSVVPAELGWYCPAFLDPLVEKSTVILLPQETPVTPDRLVAEVVVLVTKGGTVAHAGNGTRGLCKVQLLCTARAVASK